jgi:hypothetical protein
MAMAWLGLWISQVMLLLVLLWLLRQTTFGVRWDPHRSAARWQFSIMHLLAAMTTLAITLAILRHAKALQEVPSTAAIVILSSVGIAFAAVVLQAFRWHGLLRLASLAGIAMILGIVMQNIAGDRQNLLAFHLIQAIVLFLWLQFGEILPNPADGNTGVAARASTPSEADQSG